MGMIAPGRIRKHEVAFCADIKSWAEALFAEHPEWPFERAEIEEYGRGNNKRQDLRFYEHGSDTPVLCGEVKMPGTPEGRSPYDPALMEDAFRKANNIQSQYFFTSNVNYFVVFDRSRWRVPLIQRRIRHWDLELGLRTSGETRLTEVRDRIRNKFLPSFFGWFAEVHAGRMPDWPNPPDHIFLRSLETHLDWPVQAIRDYMADKSGRDKAFAARFQQWMAGEMGWTFDADNREQWMEALDRAARALCYVFSNRAIFYECLRARHPDELDPLAFPPRARGGKRLYGYFRSQFNKAVQASGDYEPILFPQVSDWAGHILFATKGAREGWRGLLHILPEYNFREIPSDVLGRVFQRLISPEERHRFGQFFTQDDIVDVIDAFCIRRAGDLVLDPACGSGSFLVRAYHRKAWLAEQRTGGRRNQDHAKTHQQLLTEVFGCDIALFPAHLATLNLASRRIQEEENYPLVRRHNFFAAADERDQFCSIPVRHRSGEGGFSYERRPVELPDLDAVVGNPPYLRQEEIPRLKEVMQHPPKDPDTLRAMQVQTKEYMADLAAQFWPGLRIPGRSDLHCYFWPVAAGMLKEGGYFGFLTSASWLDVEYGFALQAWVLQNFRLVAVIESVDEPWFEDARVKTAVTILQRCADAEKRDANLVKFVRLERPLAEILGRSGTEDEGARQKEAESFRRLIERAKKDSHKDGIRIIVVPQRDLWKEGVKAAGLVSKGQAGEGAGEESLGEEGSLEAYGAGKWGRFLRAPDFYFRLMREYGDRFVKLGEIAEIRFGIKSGCDAFFMPRDVTDKVLKDVATKGTLWRDLPLRTSCTLKEVEKGKVRIVQAGDRTLHPIEAKYLRPELHSPMEIDRPLADPDRLKRVVLWVGEPLTKLRGTYAAKYIRWGERQTFQSTKSQPVRVPERPTCASRPLWYNVTGQSEALAFWPMAQQYRHIIPANPHGLVCNHNLFYVAGQGLPAEQADALAAILNSTFLGLFKTYYGRYAGTEGNLKTEVVDVNLIDVPDPRQASADVLRRLKGALRRLQRRKVGPLVEAEFMDCHSAEAVRELAKRPISLPKELRQPDRRVLDDAVLELIGVADAAQREKMLDRLYHETALHYRGIRVVEVQKMEQRRGGGRRITANDLAESIWHALSDAAKGPLAETWLAGYSGVAENVHIPEGKAVPLGADNLYDPAGVDFKVGPHTTHKNYRHAEQAALIAALADLDIRGDVEVPQAADACKDARESIRNRLQEVRELFENLAGARTGTDRLQRRIVDLLMQWYLRGKS